MTPAEVNRFNTLYQRHLRLLKLQGKSKKTIDAYSRAVRRVSEHFDCCPDQLTPEQLEDYFGNLVDTYIIGNRTFILTCMRWCRAAV